MEQSLHHILGQDVNDTHSLRVYPAASDIADTNPIPPPVSPAQSNVSVSSNIPPAVYSQARQVVPSFSSFPTTATLAYR